MEHSRRIKKLRLIKTIVNLLIQNNNILTCTEMDNLVLTRSLKNRCVSNFHHPDINDILNGNEIKCTRHLRISQRSFRKLIREIKPKFHGWSIELEIVTFLLWLSSGASYRIVALCMNIPKSTVFDITKKILNKLLDIMSKFIHLPANDELETIGEGFARLGHSRIFSKAIGAVDGTYINIKCPPHLHEQYITRKLKYSIQLQGLCDHTGKFIDIFTGYPGSVHDQRVFTNSVLYQTAVYPPEDFFLLADSGYQLIINPIKVLTPYKERCNTQLSRCQKKFNTHHSLARNIVERSFGMLKTRWRYIFNKDSELKVTKTTKVIGACCILHNICCLENDIFIPPNEEGNTQYNANTSIINSQEGPDAQEFRDRLCELLNRSSNSSSVVA